MPSIRRHVDATCVPPTAASPGPTHPDMSTNGDARRRCQDAGDTAVGLQADETGKRHRAKTKRRFTRLDNIKDHPGESKLAPPAPLMFLRAWLERTGTSVAVGGSP